MNTNIKTRPLIKVDNTYPYIKIIECKPSTVIESNHPTKGKVYMCCKFKTESTNTYYDSMPFATPDRAEKHIKLFSQFSLSRQIFIAWMKNNKSLVCSHKDRHGLNIIQVTTLDSFVKYFIVIYMTFNDKHLSAEPTFQNIKETCSCSYKQRNEMKDYIMRNTTFHKNAVRGFENVLGVYEKDVIECTSSKNKDEYELPDDTEYTNMGVLAYCFSLNNSYNMTSVLKLAHQIFHNMNHPKENK